MFQLILLSVGALVVLGGLAATYWPEKPPVVPPPDAEVRRSLTDLAQVARTGACQFGAYSSSDTRIKALKKMIKLGPAHQITRDQLRWTAQNDWTNDVKSFAMEALLEAL